MYCDINGLTSRFDLLNSMLMLPRKIIITIVFQLSLLLGVAYGQTNYYVETTGADAGTCPVGAPCATVQWVIDNQVLGPGDTIFVGAGTWTDEPITFSAADDGDATGFVTLQGVDSSTTVFEYFLGASNQIHLDEANYVKVRNIKFDDASDDVVQISGGDHNVIEHCWILDGSDQVSIEASGSNTADQNIVRNNLMESSSFTYVDINGNNSGGTFICTGNQIYDNVMQLLSGGNANPGIELSYADDTEIFRNRMLGATRGIEIENTGGGDGTLIYNNYIRTSDDSFYNNGAAATSSNGELRHNSFYSEKTCAYFRNLSGANVGGWDIRNNIFYTTSTSSSEYCLRIEGSTNADFCDYNQYYHPGSARCARFNGTAYASLSGTGGVDWDEVDHSDEAGMLGDENSQEGDPLYNNPTGTAWDFLDLAAMSPCYANGVTLAGIPTDIYLAVRPVNPAIGAFDNIATLPVELLSFNASEDGRQALLQWRTATEVNNASFVIERSEDGLHFEALTSVPGAGTSNMVITYSTIDTDPKFGVNYYRLKQVNYDGTSSFSGVRTVEFSTSDQAVSIYPNPIASGSPFTIHGSAIGCRIYTTQGSLLNVIALDPTNPYQQVQLSERMVSGIYLVVIEFRDGTLQTCRLTVE